MASTRAAQGRATQSQQARRQSQRRQATEVSDKIRELKPTRKHYSITQLVEELKPYWHSGSRRLAAFAANGLIPFASKLDDDWIIDRRGVEFLVLWLAKRKYWGSLWYDVVRRAAGKLDRSCLQRQAEHSERQRASGGNPRRKVTREMVLAIRKMRGREGGPVPLSEIARRYMLDISTVSYIASGRSHRNVQAEPQATHS